MPTRTAARGPSRVRILHHWLFAVVPWARRGLHIAKDVTVQSNRRFVRPAILVPAAALAMLGLGAFLLARWPRDAAQTVPAEEALLLRQTRELEVLAAAAEAGTLVDFDQMLVVVDQRFVQELLAAVVPLEGDVGGGFHVRIDAAEAAFDDGLALLRLKGEVRAQGRAASAELRVLGGLDVVELDPTSGILGGRVTVFGVEATRADILGMDESVRGLTEVLTHGGLARLVGPIEIPVRVENHLALPAVQTERLRIPASEVALQASVKDVKVFGGKLWVRLGATLPESSEGAANPSGTP